MAPSLPLGLLCLVASVGVGIIFGNRQTAEDLDTLDGSLVPFVGDLGVTRLRKLAGEAERVDEAFLGRAPGEEQGRSCEVDVLVVDDGHRQGHGNLTRKVRPRQSRRTVGSYDSRISSRVHHEQE